MDIQLTANSVKVNGVKMNPAPSHEAIADQLKYMLFGTVPDGGK